MPIARRRPLSSICNQGRRERRKKRMAVEYRCEGCGVRVTTLPVSRPPAHGFCFQCAFLCAYVPDPVEMVALRKALDADRREDDEPVSHRVTRSAEPGGC
jgi:hypothetical protein